MLDGYHLFTLTHRHAPLATLGQLVLPETLAPERLTALKNDLGWDELLCLTTCNRALYAFYTPGKVDVATVRSAFVATLRPDLPAAEQEALATRLRYLHSGDAVRHLLEVTASMDSLVVGEREIVRQVREAYRRCHEWGLTGDHFRLLMRHAVETSKLVYNQTGIGEKALSVVALAYGQMRRAGVLPQSRVLLVGAGDTNALFAKMLLKDGFQHVSVANRTFEKAAEVAGQFAHGRALRLSELPATQVPFDALVVCTAATEPLVTSEFYHQLLAGDTSSKVVVDLAVPNNVATDVSEQFSIQYIEIEGLKSLAAEHLAHRERARQQAEGIVSERLVAFKQAWHQRQIERALVPMAQSIKAAKERAVNEVFAREFATLDPAAQALVQKMLDYVEQKAVAIPMQALRTIEPLAQLAGHP